jgi:hypothetical protein
MDRLRNKLSYANVVATIAVFVAIGGTSYAAINLPRNSVGARELKPRAVGSSEVERNAIGSRAVRAGSLTIGDFDASTRSALRGEQGPAGPAGPAGVEFHASVDSAGRRIAGNSLGSSGTGVNRRILVFDRDVSTCTPVATLARNAGGVIPEPPPGRIVVAARGSTVEVDTYDENGTPAALPFNLLVAC